MPELTRRSLLRRGSAVAGTAALAPMAAVIAPAAGQPADSGFSARRQRTYLALVTAVAAAGGTHVAASRADDAVRDFAAWYEQQDDADRASVDYTLDTLEASPPNRAFSELDRPARVGLLRSHAGRSNRKAGAHGDRSESGVRILAANAIGYAALPFDLSVEDVNHRPATSIA